MIFVKDIYHHIEGDSKKVLAELIFVIKKLQKDWREHKHEELFKKIIRDCLDEESLENVGDDVK